MIDLSTPNSHNQNLDIAFLLLRLEQLNDIVKAQAEQISQLQDTVSEIQNRTRNRFTTLYKRTATTI